MCFFSLFIVKSPQRVPRLVFCLNLHGSSQQEQMTHGREIPTW